MAPRAATNTHWTTEFDTARREDLFRHPPPDHTAYPALQSAIRPHIDSFNALFDREDGLLAHGLHDVGTKTFLDGEAADPPSERNRLNVRIKEVYIDKAEIPPSNKFSTKNREIFPAECRERHATYRGKLRGRLEYSVNNGEWKETVREFGQLPLMLKSNRCHLERLSPAQLVQAKEESEELGGYFIVNGIEKLVRMLIVSRRNHPMALIRPSFANRGKSYSQYGISIRSVRPDQTSQTNVLHYLNDGNVTFRFSWRKSEYLIPLMMILKSLVETNDREIFESIAGTIGFKGLDNTFLTDRVELLLRTYKSYGLHSKSKTRAYLGAKFRVVLGVSDSISDGEVGGIFLRKIVLPHLGNQNVTEDQDADKFRMLLFMVRKLYALVARDCAPDNPDSVQHQEILVGGFLYSMILKERLEEWLTSIGGAAQEWLRGNAGGRFTDTDFSRHLTSRILKRTNENVGSALEYFLSTGNLVSPSGLDLQQTSGYTVVAEKINFYRFISHFRMVHRGSFFAELKTTTVRKLLPESWGFLCPVHTPDGSPCGLLNHLAHKCQITTKALDTSSLPTILRQLGLQDPFSAYGTESMVVQLDGRILGWCSSNQAQVIADTLRYWKVERSHEIPTHLEIGYIPSSNGGQYPGIYLFSQQARLVRPVEYLPLQREDFVGPFEQPYLSIACTKDEIVPRTSTHVEYDPTNILSIVANMTPFSDFNQSPRNMYQCQMGKQSMGTPGTALRYRTDNKAYRLQTGQTPIVRPPLHNAYGLDNFPNGMNAVVAVISYTGYDMDDAMIINKQAHERGFGHGTIYKTQVIDLEEKSSRTRGLNVKNTKSLFGFAPGDNELDKYKCLGEDGLPEVGVKIEEGDVIAVSHSVSYDGYADELVNRDGITNIHRYKDPETAYVEEVRIMGTDTGVEPMTAISIKFRIPRSPVIGDKFSSRHGQKGVCSQKWPAADMPFSESGMIPDVIINPHAFPSRMTIGMFVESLAGKAGALHGLAQDSSPFKFDAENTALNYFGHQLKKAGYNYYGNEPMYSGVTGTEFHADIYLGVVYYQRLRHMVNDKFQVRTTGPVTAVTGQPIKGRKKGGGIRVGEMERDAILAHGTAFLLQDRLLNCSDYTKSWICRKCGSFLATQPTSIDGGMNGTGSGYRKSRPFGASMAGRVVRCRQCAKRAQGWESKSEVWEDGTGVRWVGGADTTLVAVPGVLKYLDVELAAMGVKMKFKVEP